MPRDRSTLRPRVALGAVLALGAALLAGCSSTVALQSPPASDDPRCAELMVRLPAAFDDQDRRWTDAQSTAAWGDPTTVQLACGVTPPGPTELPCQSVSGVDWIVDDSQAPLYRITTYGRVPAVELIIDYDAVSSRGPVDAVSRVIVDRFETDAACVAASEVTPDAEAP
ncbi:DUF3515 domain-containing protein [Microbacterium sp. EYE_5]|uniref:DUF3515 family protein n=1 Tax=unclassified Microbacterium TaxID=2609290 RepID=UPI002004312E|nr:MULTISPECIES: DUF3515 family protein [unclassified Microbacterium]MCK6080888.1 DUF3515 domain-containing protein [Microbacterium sp. EYE_382]MCK6086159.1 DUF3515 domain-containing protein [Microbacterium sp. EYE_384]MCK6124343.1 DUF3515 domain-containing protein [Microbacterium sp. EYE_80]MCK6127252.1 DUF3515 domain-containing protein [Microbacterium sp. EYE_79]MCK6141843.1 DUF3515 domain-containing protein [Microbacterium sp. EYE_39]